MRSKHYKLIITIAASILMIGCSEDFVDKKPIATDTEESFYASFDRLDMTATAAYGILCTRDLDYFYFIRNLY